MAEPAEARALLDGCRQLYAGNRAARQQRYPPHDLEAETIVVSAALWCDRTAHELGLLPSDFWDPGHRRIWAVLLTVEEQLGDDADPGTRCWVVTRVVHVRGRRLLEILRSCAVWAREEHYAATVLRLSRQRQLLAAMARIDAALRAGEPPDPRWVRAAVRRLEEICSSKLTFA